MSADIINEIIKNTGALGVAFVVILFITKFLLEQNRRHMEEANKERQILLDHVSTTPKLLVEITANIQEIAAEVSELENKLKGYTKDYVELKVTQVVSEHSQILGTLNEIKNKIEILEKLMNEIKFSVIK
jgi:chromosome segregation ATPase